MILRSLKKTALLGLAVLSACAAPIASAPRYERDVVRVASLIAGEIDSRESLDLFSLSRHIVALSHYYNLDPLLVLAIVKVESQFKPDARSFAGAIGLMQVMPIVLREVGDEIAVRKREDLYDPYKNLHLGIHYLTFLLEKYDHNLQNALVAYNLGPSALDSRLSRKRQEIPLTYYRKVMQFYKAFLERFETAPEVT
jgi:soluble lytic murein transglycosylase-like protein